MATVDKIFTAVEKLGITLALGKDGLTMSPPRDRITPEKYAAIRELRMVMSRNRAEIIRRLGGDPANYRWEPVEGTPEREWYDHLMTYSQDRNVGIVTAMSGREWHTKKDADRLLTSCCDSIEWKDEARRFWWDTTHQQSWRSDDYDWPIPE